MTALYDVTRANIDWKNCKQLACMHIRGLHLSKLCNGSIVWKWTV